MFRAEQHTHAALKEPVVEPHGPRTGPHVSHQVRFTGPDAQVAPNQSDQDAVGWGEPRNNNLRQSLGTSSLARARREVENNQHHPRVHGHTEEQGTAPGGDRGGPGGAALSRLEVPQC